MTQFPVDALKARALRALDGLGFRLIREGNHMSMVLENEDGTRTPPLTVAVRLRRGQ
jgi:hypothetical protein